MGDEKPQTLDEAIAQALAVGSLSDVRERIFDSVHQYLIDCFIPFYLVGSREEATRLSELFQMIVKKIVMVTGIYM